MRNIGSRLSDVSPNLHHAPPLNDVNKTAILREKKKKPI
jgi:hypothetical protein